ncbi:MAG: hypothetical protein ACOYN5_05145, partial [Bacteroidales bacterium]
MGLNSIFRYGFLLVLIICTRIASAQEIIVNDYQYTYFSTDKSPKEAIRSAISEALVNCLKEKTQVQIQSVSMLNTVEENRQVKDAYYNQLLESTAGIIQQYTLTDTIQELNRDGVLKTQLIMNVVILKQDEENLEGLTASLDKQEYNHGEKAILSASVMVPSYLYIFDVSGDTYNLIYAAIEQQPANKPLVFPNDRFEMVMEKSNNQPVEFGSLFIMASQKPIAFTSKPKSLYMDAVSFSTDEFRKKIRVHGSK